MSSDNNVHLHEDQLIAAVVDEEDLPPSSREHLSACPRCRKEKVRLRRDLEQIGRLAEHHSPSSIQRVHVPASEPRAVFPWLRHRQAVFGFVFSAMLLVVFIWWFGNSRFIAENGTKMAAYESRETERLMTEVGMLTENALPAVFMQITGESQAEESYTDFDEEFIQFIIPPIDDGPHSGRENALKGVKSC